MTTTKIPALKIIQNNTSMLVFTCPVKIIYERFDVSRRIEDKVLGYQRSFSKSRIQQIKTYITQEDGIIPNSVLVNFDDNKFSYIDQTKELTLNNSGSLGLIIDGQHRVKGCYEADSNFPLMVIATLGLSVKEQARLFVKINQTQKGVPASLYLDLMNILEGEIDDFDQEGVSAERRATEIAIRLNEDEDSPLYELIRRTGDSGFGISLSEFVNQTKGYVDPKSGKLAEYGFEDQYKIFSIYFRSLKAVFLEQWNHESYILKTVGFGGIMKAFYEIFNLVIQKYQRFNTDSTIEMLKLIQDFKFDKDTLPSGGGFRAQERAGELIITKLKSMLKESQSFATMIGD